MPSEPLYSLCSTSEHQEPNCSSFLANLPFPAQLRVGWLCCVRLRELCYVLLVIKFSRVSLVTALKSIFKRLYVIRIGDFGVKKGKGLLLVCGLDQGLQAFVVTQLVLSCTQPNSDSKLHVTITQYLISAFPPSTSLSKQFPYFMLL